MRRHFTNEELSYIFYTNPKEFQNLIKTLKINEDGSAISLSDDEMKDKELYNKIDPSKFIYKPRIEDSIPIEYEDNVVMISSKSFYENIRNSLYEDVTEINRDEIFKLLRHNPLPSEEVKQFIIKSIGCDEKDIFLSLKKDTDKIALFINVKFHYNYQFTYDDEIRLRNLFAKCGYFKAHVFENANKTFFVYQFEPYKYDNGERICLGEQIWHFTPIYNKQNIIDNGFIMSYNKIQTDFDYPPRNYFWIKMSDRVVRLFWSLIPNKMKEEYQDKDGNLPGTLFTVSTKNLKHIKFYASPAYKNFNPWPLAVYCYKNISKDNIINYQDMLLSKDNK